MPWSHQNWIAAIVYFMDAPTRSFTNCKMVQHNAARLIYRKRKGHITPLLIELHWLPVEVRIDYKICLLVFKCQNQSAPSYLQDLVTSYAPRRENLRSATSHRMDTPIVKQQRGGERSFMYAAAKVWNKLPLHVKTSPTIETFKTSLKTYLFKDYYKV